MAYFSCLVLLCLAAFAKDVIELEPVKSLSFNCGRLTTAGQEDCQKSPYCYWNSTVCIDDPCLIDQNRVLSNPQDTCTTGTNGVFCQVIDLVNVLGADCSNATLNTGYLCGNNQTVISPKEFTYCTYAYIRDQACPLSICETKDGEAGCIPKNTSSCTLLKENDCKNVPKCLWNNSQCITDPCFPGSESVNCATWNASDTVAAGDCIDFKPLKSQTSNIVNYCVYKTSTNPNICYFAPTASNSTAAALSPDDYGITYPTFNATDNVTLSSILKCEGELPGCEGTGECYTTLIQKGALAGLYCTDGTHGAASVLRIPSVILFLAVCALSMFIV